MTRAAFFARGVDGNQGAVVKALRKLGAHVAYIYRQGEGCPDLLVGWRGRWYPVEVKAGDARLTPAEVRWHAAAKRAGLKVLVVRSPADAVEQLAAARVSMHVDGEAVRVFSVTPNTRKPTR
jgi:hypothetical protein